MRSEDCGLSSREQAFSPQHSLLSPEQAKVAQLVERVSEKHEVTGSCPVLGTFSFEQALLVYP